MPDIKFFHQLADPLMAFIDMKAPRRTSGKTKKQSLSILFRMPLNGNSIRSAPEFIRTAYEGVKDNGERLVELKKELDGVEIIVFELPNKRQKKIHDFGACRLENLAVKEIKSGKGDPSIVLTFESAMPLPDHGLFRFMHDHYKTEVFLRFDSTQASLLELPDVEDEQPGLPGVVDGGKEESESAEGEGAEA